jgi:protein gp37
MAANSSIEWTGDTANVFYAVARATGKRGWMCVKVGPGCLNCYAERLNRGFFRLGTGHRYMSASLDEVELVFDRRLAEGWARRRLPRIIFVNGMTDTFGEFYSDAWVFKLLDHMAAAPQHTFQVLTKRAERMYHTVTAWLHDRGIDRVPKHIQLIVSVETQESADGRIPWLVETPCARGLSVEPLLGPIPELPLSGIHWVIAGGESGPQARLMEPTWIRDIRDQCQAAGVKMFLKQWGKLSNNPDPNDPTARRNGGRAKGGRMLDGRTWDETSTQLLKRPPRRRNPRRTTPEAP